MNDFRTPLPSQPVSRPEGPLAGAPEAILAEVAVYTNQVLLTKYSIEQGEYIIGRDSTCHIIVDADQVSRHHARLTLSGFELLIEDIGSSNGVFIDGVQVQIPTRIRSDQEIQIGSARLRIGLRESASRQLAEALGDKDLGLEPVRQMLEAKKYRIITTIGRGGMGVVMQARDLRIRRTVAMKVMKTSSQFSRENVLRFIDEAQLTGQLEHPNIVPVYELGLDEQGETFYVMKYVKGITLEEVIRGLRSGNPHTVAKYPLAQLITIFQKICDAVAFAHSKSVVHRDLKPENVMIGAYGEVLVMDWGLAKNLTAAYPTETATPEIPHAHPASDGRGFQTMHGLVVGTPPYISPEQARGELEKIDARSDLFVLGEILYAILALRAPVVGESVAEVLEKILSGEFSPPSRYNQSLKSSRNLAANANQSADEHVVLVHCPGRRIPDGLSAVVMKAMQRDPASRYQSVEEMQDDITAWQGGFPTKAERAGLLTHLLLFVGRHKGEVALFSMAFVVFNVLVLGFIYEVEGEKNRAVESERRALQNEQRARSSEQLAAERLNELRGTAPTYYEDARNLVDDQNFEEALDKIDYAIEQVPNEPDYLFLRGNILQSLLRWDEAEKSYEEALRRNPKFKQAKLNLDLTRRLHAQALKEGKFSVPILREFHDSLMKQDRMGEALAVLKQIGRDRSLFETTWRAVFEKRGLRDRVIINEDETLAVDLSRLPVPDLRKLGDSPVVSLILDDAKISDLIGLKGRSLHQLSINHTFVHDLAPLQGMPLRTLSAESSHIVDLTPLAKSPLESLKIGDTRVVSLAPLRGLKLELLNLSNCRLVRDLAPLNGMPLQNVNLSKTAITDLTALTQSPIRELNLEGCVDLIDLTPLLAMKTLEGVIIPTQCKDIAFLRDHPSIRRLSYKKLTQPVADFWKEFDALALKGSLPYRPPSHAPASVTAPAAAIPAAATPAAAPVSAIVPAAQVDPLPAPPVAPSAPPVRLPAATPAAIPAK